MAWYSASRRPRRYLEFGIGRGCAAGVVAAACPSVEVYGIDRWEGLSEGLVPFGVAATLRRRLDHKGYVRFINGDPETALQRLQDSFVGAFALDLVLVRGDLLGASAAQQVAKLLACLAAGGALVLTSSSADRFKAMWEQAQRCFPHYSYIQYDSGLTGLILAATLRSDGSGDAASGLRVPAQRLTWIERVPRLWRLRARALSALKKAPSYPKCVVGRPYRWAERRLSVYWRKR